MSGAVERFSVITCPQCGTARREEMTDNACQFFYECTGCHALLKPRSGDCCVFCSYGSVKCRSRQLD
ncbi:MAG: GDCCVxC domain-containing (seleno)protein [Burkholderiales bacterium]